MTNEPENSTPEDIDSNDGYYSNDVEAPDAMPESEAIFEAEGLGSATADLDSTNVYPVDQATGRSDSEADLDSKPDHESDKPDPGIQDTVSEPGDHDEEPSSREGSDAGRTNTDETNAGGGSPGESNAGGPSTGFPGTSGPASYYQPLLRDPHGMFAGIASGLGKRYGIDVSLVRLVFVALAFTGVGLLAYIAAWFIIPKSAVPLVATPINAETTKRALGGGLVLAAIVFGLSASGTSGAVLIPLALLGGGIWLLMQPGTEPTTAPTVPAQAFGGQPLGGQPASGQQNAMPPRTKAPANAYVAQSPPVAVARPKRRRGLKFLLLGLLAIFALFVLALVGALVSFVGSDGDVFIQSEPDGFQIDFESDSNEASENFVVPAIVEEIPGEIFDGRGELTLDLSELDADSLVEADRQVVSSIQRIGGSTTILVPGDLSVRINASVDEGTIDYLGDVESGSNILRVAGPADADLVLNVDAASGQINIERP